MPRLQILRSITAGARPTGKLYGEPYVNVTDNQFGVFDSGNNPRDLIGVPYFSSGLSYIAGAVVCYQGLLYVAKGAISAGAFTPAQWYQITANLLSSSITANITVGYTFTPYNGGTISSGTVTPNAANGNYQYYTNNGAHSIAVPASDCALDILITNGAAAGAITFSGYTVGTTGDPFTTTSGHRFILSIRRINAISTYAVKALQ